MIASSRAAQQSNKVVAFIGLQSILSDDKSFLLGLDNSSILACFTLLF